MTQTGEHPVGRHQMTDLPGHCAVVIYAGKKEVAPDQTAVLLAAAFKASPIALAFIHKVNGIKGNETSRCRARTTLDEADATLLIVRENALNHCRSAIERDMEVRWWNHGSGNQRQQALRSTLELHHSSSIKEAVPPLLESQNSDLSSQAASAIRATRADKISRLLNPPTNS